MIPKYGPSSTLIHAEVSNNLCCDETKNVINLFLSCVLIINLYRVQCFTY